MRSFREDRASTVYAKAMTDAYRTRSARVDDTTEGDRVPHVGAVPITSATILLVERRLRVSPGVCVKDAAPFSNQTRP
jgi:hypothetical protein